jgi:hypothetical protein
MAPPGGKEFQLGWLSTKKLNRIKGSGRKSWVESPDRLQKSGFELCYCKCNVYWRLSVTNPAKLMGTKADAGRGCIVGMMVSDWEGH